MNKLISLKEMLEVAYKFLNDECIAVDQAEKWFNFISLQISTEEILCLEDKYLNYLAKGECRPLSKIVRLRKNNIYIPIQSYTSPF